MVLRADPTAWALGFGLALAAAFIGVLAGIEPGLAIAASVGVCFVLLVLADLTLGLVVFTVFSFLAMLPVIGGAASSFLKVTGLLLAISWFALIATRNDARLDFASAHPLVTSLLVGLLTWVACSAIWAEDPASSFTALSRWALNALLFLIVFTAVRERKHVVRVLAAVIVGVGFAAAYALIAGPADPYELTRLGSGITNPNELASALVVGVTLGVAMAGGGVRSPIARAGAASLALISLIGVLLTLSRGGLIAFGCVLVAGVLFGGRWRVLVLVLGAAVAASAAVYFGAFASDEARERVTSTESEGEGRVDLWEVGWRMSEANPVRGVGADNFEIASVQYLLEPGALRRDEFIVDEPKSAHNMYLQVLAELGVVGLALFLALLGMSLVFAFRAIRRFQMLGDRQLEILSRALLVALIGLLVADFFGSRQYTKELWLLLAMAPSLLAVGMRMHPESAPGDFQRAD